MAMELQDSLTGSYPQDAMVHTRDHFLGLKWVVRDPETVAICNLELSQVKCGAWECI